MPIYWMPDQGSKHIPILTPIPLSIPIPIPSGWYTYWVPDLVIRLRNGWYACWVSDQVRGIIWSHVSSILFVIFKMVGTPTGCQAR